MKITANSSRFVRTGIAQYKLLILNVYFDRCCNNRALFYKGFYNMSKGWNMRELYIVAYDISDARRRRKVRNHIMKYALDFQKSLFECWCTEAEITGLINSLKQELFREDYLHIFRTHQAQALYLGGAMPRRYGTLIIQ